MSRHISTEVFTAGEIARATGVDRRAVEALLEAGEVSPIPGTRYLRSADAIRLGRRLRARVPAAAPSIFDLVRAGRGRSLRRSGGSAAVSSMVHGFIIATVLWITAGPTETAPVEEIARTETRLVFLVTPGPGGGGGGSLRSPLPPRRLTRRGPERPRVSVPRATPKPVMTAEKKVPDPPKPSSVITPRPVERAPEPLPAQVLVAPVVTAAADTTDRDGVVDAAQDEASEGTAAGNGTGSGDGLGSGIGDGMGGGTGGGPYRPGSGIDPPRLMREVKAEYTDEARRRGVTGEVVLEIVVRSDGSVGDVRTVSGLGAGLDQRAVAAVRQWRFDPARRRGVPVDVIVEVAVEFTLR